MCEELDEELARGNEAAKALVEHIENMGMPGKIIIPVETDLGCYIVEARKTL